MIVVDAKRDARWLRSTVKALRDDGCAVVEGVLDRPFIEATRSAMLLAQAAILQEVGGARLQHAGEVGVLRLMLKYHPHFFEFLALPEVLAIVDTTVSETAILHLQNGFVLPSFPPGVGPSVFQMRFHMDFPRVLNGFVASVNVLFAIDDFRRDNGATLVVPGTHQRLVPPSAEDCLVQAVPIECPAGSMLVFDSTLWHAAGPNHSGRDRFAINHQFTRSYIKQQIDYVRALGPAVVLAQKPRTQQLLGWYTRVPTSLLEYYRPEADRLYRKGQG
jgi:ectoine hydroxylase-related dioxygenase (phytanoyl-CoA dioxygenase family)